MKYNKLVRDKIPVVIKRNGGVPIIHVASDDEYWQKLKEKLHEEVSEFVEAENLEEMADVLEVIDAIYEYKNFKKPALSRMKKKKARERGKFIKRIILEEA